MDLSDYEKIVFAYYLDKGALDLVMAPRFWPHTELVMLIEDKIQLITRKMGQKAFKSSAVVARAFADSLIEKGGFSNTKGKFGGTMHQYQEKAYPDAVKELQANNPIVQQARASAPDYWEHALR